MLLTVLVHSQANDCGYFQWRCLKLVSTHAGTYSFFMTPLWTNRGKQEESICCNTACAWGWRRRAALANRRFNGNSEEDVPLTINIFIDVDEFYLFILITSVYMKYFLVLGCWLFFPINFHVFSFENDIKLKINVQCAQMETRILCYGHRTSQDGSAVIPPVNTNRNWKLIRQDHFSQEQVYIGLIRLASFSHCWRKQEPLLCKASPLLVHWKK